MASPSCPNDPAYSVQPSLSGLREKTGLIGVNWRSATLPSSAPSLSRIYVAAEQRRCGLDPRARIPDEIGDAPTEVVRICSLALFTGGGVGLERRRLRPAHPGSSIGGAPGSGLAAGACTLGAVVSCAGARHILTAAHPFRARDRPVLQPAASDGGAFPDDVIARVTRIISAEPGRANLLDCALVGPVDRDAVSEQFLPPVGRLSSPIPIAVGDGVTVEKVGRGTGHSLGTVVDTNVTMQVSARDGSQCWMHEQILVRAADGRPFAGPGDSGAVVVDSGSGRAAGLIIGGSEEVALVTPLARVLAALEAELVA